MFNDLQMYDLMSSYAIIELRSEGKSMDWAQTGITIFSLIIGSGLIQWWFSRKDKQKEDAKKDNADSIKKEMKDHLTAVNDQWKIDYCDKNAKAIEELAKDVKTGLQQREETGAKRYEEHKLAIEKINIQHQKDFLALKEAIQKLTDNDSKITKNIEKMADKQDIIASANVGMIHNTIIRFTDPILARGLVTYEELATLDSLYVPYSRLGGNGECKRRYDDVNKLTKVTTEKAIERDREIEAKGLKELREVIGA